MIPGLSFRDTLLATHTVRPGVTSHHHTICSASKAAMNSLSVNMRVDLQNEGFPDIRIAVFSPGLVATDFGLHAVRCPALSEPCQHLRRKQPLLIPPCVPTAPGERRAGQQAASGGTAGAGGCRGHLPADCEPRRERGCLLAAELQGNDPRMVRSPRRHACVRLPQLAGLGVREREMLPAGACQHHAATPPNSCRRRCC